jgi:hypothetical protein
MSVRDLLLGISQQTANRAAPMPLLDDLTDYQIVLSVRLLRTAYTGNCIEVRRSSDNTTQNIGFVNGYLDTTSLLSFAGAGSAYIKTWYDQSGNGRNYVQATNANQPRIVNSGTLDTQNSKAAIVFDGSTSRLAAASDYTLTKDQSGYIVNTPAATITAATGFQVLVEGGPITANAEDNTLFNYGSTTGNLSNERLSYLYIAQRYETAGTQVYGYGQTSSDITSGIYLHNFNYSGTTATIYQNGSSQTLDTSTYSGFYNPSSKYPTKFKALGYRSANNTGHFNGKIQEFILFNADKTSTSRTTIENDINSFYSIW